MAERKAGPIGLLSVPQRMLTGCGWCWNVSTTGSDRLATLVFCTTIPRTFSPKTWLEFLSCKRGVRERAQSQGQRPHSALASLNSHLFQLCHARLSLSRGPILTHAAMYIVVRTRFHRHPLFSPQGEPHNAFLSVYWRSREHASQLAQPAPSAIAGSCERNPHEQQKPGYRTFPMLPSACRGELGESRDMDNGLNAHSHSGMSELTQASTDPRGASVSVASLLYLGWEGCEGLHLEQRLAAEVHQQESLLGLVPPALGLLEECTWQQHRVLQHLTLFRLQDAVPWGSAGANPRPPPAPSIHTKVCRNTQVYTGAHMHKHIGTHVCEHRNSHIHMHKHTCKAHIETICTKQQIYRYTCTCACRNTSIHMQTQGHTDAHISTHTCTPTHTHTHEHEP